ncbi:MAG TPA: hypothetical protein VHD62_03955 [Opitutaceae bacterium]|nr:hypothetical protein [Opitutaceae bacterium]
MKTHSATRDRLHLEFLETRTLLAADLSDPFGLTSDLSNTMHAVSGTGHFDGTFLTNFGNHRLVLTGSDTSSITIDLDQLPSYITSLKISSFADVKIVGTDRVEDLIITDVGSVNAAGLDVTDATFTTNVHSLTVDSLGTNAVLSGSTMSLTAHSLENTTIFSDVHTLTVTSDSKAIQYIAIPGSTTDQTLNLTYVPDVLGISGIPSSAVHIVLPGTGNDSSSSSTTPTTHDTHPTDNTSVPVDVTTHLPDSEPVKVNTAGSGSISIDHPAALDLPITINGHPLFDATVTTGSSGGGPAVEPNHLVIVSLPLDERTRALLDELRTFLHSSGIDADQSVIDLFGHASTLTSTVTTANPTDVALKSTPINLPSINLWSHGDTLLGAAPLPQLGLLADKSAAPVSLDHIFSLRPSTSTGQSATETTPAIAPTAISVPGVVNVDVTWPGAVASNVTEAPRASVATDANVQPAPATVMDNVRAFGSYVVERMSAEFSPGQQSLVLLVDPQPSRPIGTRKNSTEIADDPLQLSLPGVSVVAA